MKVKIVTRYIGIKVLSQCMPSGTKCHIKWLQKYATGARRSENTGFVPGSFLLIS